MLLVSREVLFDVMRHKHDIKLTEDENVYAFDSLCSKASTEYKLAMKKIHTSEDDAMDLYTNIMLRFMNDNKKDIRYVGQGSSRIVFAMANGTAIKLAKNVMGIGQNRQEVKTCMDPTLKYEIFPDFYNADKTYWLALNCELCAKAKALDFKDAFFAQPTTIVEVIVFIFETMKDNSWSLDSWSLDTKLSKAYQFFKYVSNNGVKANLLKNIIESKTEAFKALKSLFNFYNMHSLDTLLLGDVEEIQNWGITERNGEKVPVIIDAGFSEEVFQKFYNIGTAI